MRETPDDLLDDMPTSPVSRRRLLAMLVAWGALLNSFIEPPPEENPIIKTIKVMVDGKQEEVSFRRKLQIETHQRTFNIDYANICGFPFDRSGLEMGVGSRGLTDVTYEEKQLTLKAGENSVIFSRKDADKVLGGLTKSSPDKELYWSETFAFKADIPNPVYFWLPKEGSMQVRLKDPTIKEEKKSEASKTSMLTAKVQ
jgi:hypothetical protein